MSLELSTCSAAPFIGSLHLLVGAYSIEQPTENLGKVRHCLEADARSLRKARFAVTHRDAGRQFAKQRGAVHGEVCKIETKAGNRMQREKMPGMRRTTRTAPAAGSESIQNSPILDNAIAERNIEL